MPFTWRINIKPNPKPGGPAVFEFDQPPQIQVGDQIIWSNQDSVAHFPTPDPPPPPTALMSNQIAPHSTSSAFAPGNVGTVNYFCSLHPTEKASFTVQSTSGT
jgi:plastocyanin